MKRHRGCCSGAKHKVQFPRHCHVGAGGRVQVARARSWITFLTLLVVTHMAFATPLYAPDPERFTQEAAERMIAVGRGMLAPVYGPLAEQIVNDFNLDALPEGIGIDLGGGSGNLLLELCRRTQLHWINADINPHFFAHFFEEATARGLGHRVSAIFADAHALPFRDDYADIIVSRGSYHFWDDKGQGFSEIMRVLKPGGVAWIGRGFARDMPAEVARPIRDKQGAAMVYDRQAEAESLKALFAALHIETYRIEIPEAPDDSGLNYGIWIELHAPME